MQWTDRIRQVKIVLVIAAVCIAVISLIVSHFLVRDLSKEERNKMEVWAEAMRSLNTADESTDLNLVLKVINENHTIPVVVTDTNGAVTAVTAHLRSSVCTRPNGATWTWSASGPISRGMNPRRASSRFEMIIAPVNPASTTISE